MWKQEANNTCRRKCEKSLWFEYPASAGKKFLIQGERQQDNQEQEKTMRKNGRSLILKVRSRFLLVSPNSLG